MILSVREIKKEDIEPLSDYWLSAPPDFLTGMGCDVCKMPTKEDWHKMLTEQISTELKKKKSYCLIWEYDDKKVGHSNVNKIIFGKEAYMHLHLWIPDTRAKGFGTDYAKESIPVFFNNLQLQKLYCEPFAENEAPNKTLAKLGFTFVKEYETVPGSINLLQKVNLWEITKQEVDKWQ